MRAARRALGVSLFVFLPLSCAVYKADILPSDVEEGGAASNGGSGSTAAGTASGGASGRGGAGSAPSTGTAGESGADGGASYGGDGSGGMPSGGMTNGGAEAGGNGGAGAGAGAGGKAGGGGGGQGGADQGGGGNGGSGGKASGPLCSDHPLTGRATWVPTASHSGVGKDLVTYLTDNKITRWSTNRAQMGDEWLQIDFGATVTLTHVNLQQAQENMNDYPRQYAVIVSDEPNNLTGTVRLNGAGVAGVATAMALPVLASGRYLLIRQLGASLSWWSVVELEVSCVDAN
jgi:hypothetical protein